MTIEVSLDDVDAGRAQRFIVTDGNNKPLAEVRYCTDGMSDERKLIAAEMAQDCIGSLATGP